MKKHLFGTAMAAAVLILVCGALRLSYPTRVDAQAAPDSHMAMTKLRPLEAGDKARGEIILANAKKFAERYRDYRKA